MLGRYKVWIGLFVSLFFLILLFHKANFQEMMYAISEANYVFLIPAIIAYFVGVVFRAFRWHFLLSPLKRIPISSLFSVVVIGYMANNILPVRMGEFIRAYILGEKERISKTSILATIVVERMFDGLALLLFLVLILTFIPLNIVGQEQGSQFFEWLQGIARITAIFFVGFLAVFLAMASSKTLTLRVTSLVIGILPSGVRSKGLQLMEVFIGGLAVLQSPAKTLTVFSFSLLAWLAEASMYYLVMLGFSLNVPFHIILLVTATANLAISVPSSQGGVGPFEFFTVQTLVLAGVGAGIASAYAIVLHAVLLIPVTILGFFYLWRQGMSLRELSGRQVVRIKNETPQV